MSPRRDPAWLEANQRSLAREFARLRGRLLAALPDAPEAAPEPPPPADADLTTVIALERAFGLSAFERDLLLLAAAMELDPAMPALAERLQGQAVCSLGLGLAVLEAPHWSALGPEAPLRRWRLLSMEAGAPLARAALRVDPRVLFWLLGVEAADPILAPLLRTVAAPARLTQAEGEAVALAGAAWMQGEGAIPPVLEIPGATPDIAPRLAAAAAAMAGLGLLAMDAADIPEAPAERRSLARACERELALSAAALLVIAEAPSRTLHRFAEEMASPLLLAVPEPLAGLARPRIALAPPVPDAAERAAQWRLAFGPRAASLGPALEEAASRFTVPPEAIAEMADRLAALPAEAAAARLWEEARAAARRPLEALAERIHPAADWDDLVVPAETRALLEQIRLQARHAAAVQGRWGFAARGRSFGLAALFAGPSGTGKTMAAEVLARSLGLDLYRIDLSQTVSKYIGETEKNLKRVFDAAESSGAVLLFDEADALFGKRSEVKDSHDRYANIEVSYLLQRMEAYAGLAILTTNQRAALDPAFLRRLRFVVGFPFPDAALRAELWRRAFPPETPTEGLDAARLAQLALAGGHIRNVALGAAFLAMEDGTPVRMGHVRLAAAAEYAKLERPLTQGELEGWA